VRHCVVCHVGNFPASAGDQLVVKKFLMGLVGMASLVLAACGDDATTMGEYMGFRRDDPLQVGNLTMTRAFEDGAESPFTFRADDGKLLVVYFGFTNCPDLCPTTLADLRSAFRRLPGSEARVDVAMVTVDPQRDVPEKLVPYLKSFVADPIALRTEDESILEKVEDGFLASSTITTEANGRVNVSHTAGTYVVDSTGEVVLEWPFGIGADGMENDLRLLLEDLDPA
jgi:protein SCO1/2